MLTILSAYVGVDGAEIEGKQVVERKYYGVSGFEVKNPDSGVVIEKVTFIDGTTATRKIAISRC